MLQATLAQELKKNSTILNHLVMKGEFPILKLNSSIVLVNSNFFTCLNDFTHIFPLTVKMFYDIAVHSTSMSSISLVISSGCCAGFSYDAFVATENTIHVTSYETTSSCSGLFVSTSFIS